ncbi:MAG TPA: threonine ammonia-lyase [Solirubrobacteraceae bacterium]
MMATTGAADDRLSPGRIAQGHAAAASLVRRTPVLTSKSLSERVGGTILLKAENLQRTGSFKLRGVLSKVRAIDAPGIGVVAGSAGNHAQALAYAARAHGLPCEVFMPVDAAVSKVSAVMAFGAVVHQEGASVDECVELARHRAAEAGLAFVHPFDDEDIVAGQAGLGFELGEQVDDVATVLVPVGGGGLAAGVAIAIKQRHTDAVVVGVQAEACAPYADSLHRGVAVTASSITTIADGIAIKRPGAVTLPLVDRWLDDLVTVDEESIAEAMVLLLERAKLVVEGAGAVGVAALLSGAVRPAAGGATVAVLSGGNVDIALLAAVAARHETAMGRRIRVLTRVPDRPGGLAGLLSAIAEQKANVLTVEHVRDGLPLGVRQTGVQLSLETRGREHATRLLSALRDSDYDVIELGGDEKATHPRP